MLSIRNRILISAATSALAVCALYFACAQTAAGQLSQVTRSVVSLPASTTFTVTATNPAHQALSVPLTHTVAAAFSADVNAGTVTTATFVVQAMQSGMVTGTLGYDAPSRTVTLTPGRAFHAGEVVRGHATAGILGTGGATLQPYRWQFTAGPVNPISPCGFVDVDAGLTNVGHSSVAWADYDGDGRLDILLTGEDNSGVPVSKIYRNEGSGVFTEIGAGLTGVSCGSAAWGDYDNDGRPDILLTGEQGFLDPVSKVYHNNGDGTFSDIGAGLTGVEFSSVAWGDYDNDGWLDILLTGYAPYDPVTELWHNQGDGAFARVAAALPDVAEGATAWGDYDNDGYLDLLLTGYNNTGYRVSELWRNQGDGSFTQVTTLTGVSDGAVVWGDYNNDGRLDILLTGFGGDEAMPMSEVFRNDGNGVFTDINAGLSGVGYSAVGWGDYDNDGDLDILLTGSDIHDTALAEIYRNDGPGGFVRFGGAALTGVWYGAVAWGDFDGNGRLGLLLTGLYEPYAQELPVSRVYRSADDCHADLRIAKSAAPTAAISGTTVTYLLEFANLGSLTATSVVISDHVPVDIINPVIVSHSGATITQTGSAPSFSWQVEDLAAGLGGTIVIAGTLAELDPGLVVINIAEIGSPLDVNLSNNHPAAGVTVLERPAADLGITKIITPTAAVSGSVVTFTLAFSNTGSATAAAVVISDRVPISITSPTIVSSSGAVITQTGAAPDFAWQVQDLVAGQAGVITLTGVLSATLPAGAVITNTAESTASVDADPANNRSSATVTVLSVTPPVPPVVGVSRQGGDVVLSWADNPANSGGYLAWYSAQPYFQPFDAGAISVTLAAGATSYTHEGAAGDGVSYFYLVQGVNAVGVRSVASNRVGAIGFALTPGAP